MVCSPNATRPTLTITNNQIRMSLNMSAAAASQIINSAHASAPATAQIAITISSGRPARSQLSAAIAQAAIDPEKDQTVCESKNGSVDNTPMKPCPAASRASSTESDRSITVDKIAARVSAIWNSILFDSRKGITRNVHRNQNCLRNFRTSAAEALAVKTRR